MQGTGRRDCVDGHADNSPPQTAKRLPFGLVGTELRAPQVTWIPSLSLAELKPAFAANGTVSASISRALQSYPYVLGRRDEQMAPIPQIKSARAAGSGTYDVPEDEVMTTVGSG
jgi:hypothetical protein